MTAIKTFCENIFQENIGKLEVQDSSSRSVSSYQFILSDFAQRLLIDEILRQSC